MLKKMPSKSTMKGKATSILLFFCLMAPILVTFSSHVYLKKQIRKEVLIKITCGIDHSELELLTLSNKQCLTELKWENTEEFEYKNQMYDVVQKEHKNDTTYFWCWSDKKETKINKKLDEILAHTFGNHPKQNENLKRLVNFYESLFYVQNTSITLFQFQNEEKLFVYTSNCQSLTSSPPLPPPKVG